MWNKFMVIKLFPSRCGDAGDPGSAAGCDALLRRTEDFCAFKLGDHLGGGAPPLSKL